MIPLLLLAFFNVFSSLAYSYSPYTLDLNSRNYDYLQEDQNTSALLVKEITSFSFQQDTEKDLLPNANSFFRSYTLSLFEPCSANENQIEYLQDKRNQLEHQIFPFHFFW